MISFECEQCDKQCRIDSVYKFDRRFELQKIVEIMKKHDILEITVFILFFNFVCLNNHFYLIILSIFIVLYSKY